MYLQHLHFILHCLSYSNNIQAILDFHASILSQIEAGILTWSSSHEQTFTLQRLNFRASLKDLPSSSNQSFKPQTSNTATSAKPNKDEQERRQAESHRIVCKEFSKGSCPESADHDGKRHICHYCYWKRDMPNETHFPFACPHGKRK